MSFLKKHHEIQSFVQKVSQNTSIHCLRFFLISSEMRMTCLQQFKIKTLPESASHYNVSKFNDLKQHKKLILLS